MGDWFVKRTLRLRGIGAAVKGKVWESDALLRVGRLASFELVLDDSSVSRKHAEVRGDADGQWTVRDLESTNGTFVNGKRVVQAKLAVGDRLRVGRVELKVARLSTGL